MIRQRLAGRSSLVVTVVSCAVVGALVATIAVMSGGYTAQRMDLGDAAVWVTNQSKQMLGRANTEIQRLNTVVPAESTLLDVVQDGQSVLAVDRTSNTVGLVDPAKATVGDSVPLPPRDPQVSAAAGRVVIESGATGEVWVTDATSLASFNANSPASLDLGAGASSALATDGTLFAYSPDARKLYRMTPQSDGGATAPIDIAQTGTGATLTSVGAEWAILDPSGPRLLMASGAVSLAGTPGDGTRPVLQQPGEASDVVYVASTTGLVAVPLDGGTVRELDSGTFGTPTAPVVVGGCLYAAWATGHVFTYCEGAEPSSGTVMGVQGDAELVFRSNGNRVVLNDAANGTVWAVQDGNRVIDNWEELTPPDPDETRQVEDDDTTPPDFDKTQQPPVAVDDEFGARPGRASLLPVLLNDYDANGDVLVIDSITPIPESLGRIETINNDQQLQLTLAAAARGSVRFSYTISDGRGGTATANVDVTVRSDSENSPPQQVRTTRATVQQGGRVTTQVLGDWFDPDGDPFYVADASTQAPDSVTYTPQGSIVFTDGGVGGDTKDIALVVSDARSSAGGTLSVSVRPVGKVPIVAEPFVVRTQAGQEQTIKPLAHVRGGAGPLRLSAVPGKPDATITPDFDGGTFRFTSDVVRSHYLEYSVTDGVSTATGTIRVVVTAPPSANVTPVTVPHTAFVREQGTQEIDVLANDFDPAGGVLLVTGVTNVPARSGLRVEVLGQHILRVTLTRPLEGPEVFGYRVSNGLAEAEGTVTVIQLPPPAVRQPPIAQPDTASVRVGDIIDIPVLDNDSQPDGDELTLDPTLATPLPKGGGLLFASQRVLRYLAPDTPGNYTASYRVTAPDGQWATATVTIAVRELDRAVNNPPVPKTVTARVIAGESVRIPIPLRGIDPDGDSVTLLGQETNPQKGSVIRSDGDWIEYQAGEYSTGTDSFEYQVVDALGARARATVRVGIAALDQTAQNPVAAPDEVTTRPGATVSVQVLGNDSDPDGGTLRVTSVVPSGNTLAPKIVGDLVRIAAPTAEGRYGFIYEIQNERGGMSSNFITVVVSKDAPLARPVASDTVLRLADILGRDEVDVAVLDNVFFADGSAGSLKVSVLPGFGDSASVTDRKTVRVQVRPEGQIIPFQVAHPRDPNVTAYAFIKVPGSDDALPQLKRAAPMLTIASEKTLRIDINDYVVAVGGKKVRLTDSSKVRASHDNGEGLVLDEQTLSFTSADRYFGPASISFEVTDGDSATDPDGHIATLVLPINVTPRENQPPVFAGGQLEFEPGSSRTVDLVKLTKYPYVKDQSELEFTVLDPSPQGVSVSITGQRMTIRVQESTPKGSHTTVLVGVRDAVNEGRAGRIEIDVVPSTRPLAVPQGDAAVAKRGATTVVDVLANDAATNPFPSQPLRVIAVRGADSASLPAGVSVVPSADRSRLTVTVAPTAIPGDATLQYQVADATGDSSRYVWGQVRISVQDRPDPVANLRVAGFADRAFTLNWDPGPANNSPITEFVVTMTRASSGETFSVTTCRSTSCALTTPGNGPDNAVRLSVVARNAVGDSDPAALSTSVWSDVLPPAPVDVSAAPLDHGLRISWAKPDGGKGSPINSYAVTLGGIKRELPAGRSDASGTRYSIDVTDTGIANGASIGFTVASRNDFYGGAVWNSVTGTGVPAGPPIITGAVSAMPTADGTGDVTLAWDGVFADNGRAITAYHAVAFRDAAPSCDANTGEVSGGSVSQSVGGDARAATLRMPARQQWSFVVFAFNGQGCRGSEVVTAMPLSSPAAPHSVSVAVAPAEPMNETGIYLPVFQGVAPEPNPAPGGTASYEYRFVDDNVGDFDTPSAAIAPGQALQVGSQGYGKRAGLQVRVVERYAGGLELRSDWSRTVSAGIAVDANASVTYDAGDRRFTWSSRPNPRDYTQVEYACGDSSFNRMFPFGWCDVPADQPSVFTVRVTANGGQQYVKIYRGE